MLQHFSFASRPTLASNAGLTVSASIPSADPPEEPMDRRRLLTTASATAAAARSSELTGDRWPP